MEDAYRDGGLCRVLNRIGLRIQSMSGALKLSKNITTLNLMFPRMHRDLVLECLMFKPFIICIQWIVAAAWTFYN